MPSIVFRAPLRRCRRARGQAGAGLGSACVRRSCQGVGAAGHASAQRGACAPTSGAGAAAGRTSSLRRPDLRRARLLRAAHRRRSRRIVTVTIRITASCGAGVDELAQKTARRAVAHRPDPSVHAAGAGTHAAHSHAPSRYTEAEHDCRCRRNECLPVFHDTSYGLNSCVSAATRSPPSTKLNIHAGVHCSPPPCGPSEPPSLREDIGYPPVRATLPASDRCRCRARTMPKTLRAPSVALPVVEVPTPRRIRGKKSHVNILPGIYVVNYSA